MKMLFFYLILFGFLVGIGTSCSFFKINNPPLLGHYTYLQAPPYLGPVQRDIPIWISSDIGEADQVEIARAVEQWNFVLNGHLHLHIVDYHFNMEISRIVESVRKGGWLLMPLESDSPLIPVPKKPGLWTLAFVERIGGNHLYLVRSRLGNEDVFGVTMHEMGHLLGAHHVGNKLMYDTFSRYRYQCVDYDTMVAVAKFQGIPPGDLHYCVDNNDEGIITKTPLASEDAESNCPLQSDP